MLIRRTVASVCALCLAVPAVAAAKDVRYAGHLRHTSPAVAVGDTKYDLPGSVTPASHVTAVAPQRASQPGDDGTDGWQVAAIAEAAVLATVAVGATAAVAGRRHRAPRMGF